jgi:hypothetical protein
MFTRFERTNDRSLSHAAAHQRARRLRREWEKAVDEHDHEEIGLLEWAYMRGLEAATDGGSPLV